jgi:hypothetical protein
MSIQIEPSCGFALFHFSLCIFVSDLYGLGISQCDVKTLGISIRRLCVFVVDWQAEFRSDLFQTSAEGIDPPIHSSIVDIIGVFKFDLLAFVFSPMLNIHRMLVPHNRDVRSIPLWIERDVFGHHATTKRGDARINL